MAISFKHTVLSGLLLTTLFSLESTAAQPKIHKAGRPIKGQYIVLLNEKSAGGRGSLSKTSALAEKLTSKHGGKVDRIFKHAMNGFVVQMSEIQAQRLSEEPDVILVEEDGKGALAGTQVNPPWGLDRIDQAALPLNLSFTYGFGGSGVHIYVLDTGIRTSHVDFGGRATLDYDYYPNDGANGADMNGHGTHVAGTIGGTMYGVAKLTRIHGIRVFDTNTNASLSSFIGGLDFVSQNHVKPAVVNMSIAMLDAQGNPVRSPALDAAIQSLVSQGVTCVVAAGNFNVDASLGSPGGVAEAITVAASQSNDLRANFSNFGSVVDLFAPGVYIDSAGRLSDNDTASMSGTSMAAPHVAGVAALILERNPSMIPRQVESTLNNNAASFVIQNPANTINRLLQSNTDPVLTGFTSQSARPRFSGDVNGDGKEDVIAFDSNGIWVSISDGSKFGPPQFWSPYYGQNTGWGNELVNPRTVADVNGDGKVDVIGFGASNVYVSLSTGSSFANPVSWNSVFVENNGWNNENVNARRIADVNGDGKADLVGFGASYVYVSLSTGSAFSGSAIWSSLFVENNGGWANENIYTRALADVNGDGKSDIIGFGASFVYVALSSGTSFGSAGIWNSTFVENNGWLNQAVYVRKLADVNGDGKADIVGFGEGAVYVSLSTGSAFGNATSWTNGYSKLSGWTSQDSYPRILGKVTGSGVAGIIGFYSATLVSMPSQSSFELGKSWSKSFGR